MFEHPNPYPELVIGLVGPIGVDLDSVTESLKEELHKVGYKHEVIRVTDLMQIVDVGIAVNDSEYAEKYRSLIAYANAFCERCGNNAALAGLAITEIRNRRETLTADRKREAGIDEKKAIPSIKTAYIIRQLKRPEEIDLLRNTYGRKFIQVSVYLRETNRIKRIAENIRIKSRIPKSTEEAADDAKNLIRQDFYELGKKSGQRVSEIFHTGDVFVYGEGPTKITETVRRFIEAFFGNNYITPNRDEYGLYVATAASLRSADLSQQVGAAIFTSEGELLSLGSNEVPKAGGGTYWSGDTPSIHRDIERGVDANELRKREILYDFVSRMIRVGQIKTREPECKDEELGAYIDELMDISEIKSSQLMDIIEYGRMIHAEMSAIVDAARMGRAIKAATLFCTTFPCHMCAKHIVGSGIKRVVFLEPYPKSYAEDLHSDSITLEDKIEDRVLFEPFVGISPRRYRDIFEKTRRKDEKGHAVKWYEGDPRPRVEDKSAVYLQNENPAIASSLGEVLDELERNGVS